MNVSLCAEGSESEKRVRTGRLYLRLNVQTLYLLRYSLKSVRLTILVHFS